tara:strand:- start:122 stop:457 length:336 start_codon:yes stop_codon:yes gene_type:complete
MLNIDQYRKLTHFIFIGLFFLKFSNVLLSRIDVVLFVVWILPLLIFYFFIARLNIKSYQWFCFFLLIYFLSASLRVFGTIPNILDVLELLLIVTLFIHIMFGPKKIKNSIQ